MYCIRYGKIGYDAGGVENRPKNNTSFLDGPEVLLVEFPKKFVGKFLKELLKEYLEYFPDEFPKEIFDEFDDN